LLLLAGFAGVWLWPGTANHFQNFESRMISAALRDYPMDVKTNDMTQLRGYLASQGAPNDYQISPGLGRLALTGGGALRWRSNPVSMVCFNRGDNQMLFLFVLNRSALKNPPPETPRVSKAHDLISVAWTQGDRTYLLAGPEEPDFLKKYF
jgi:hypothetical protein